MKTFSILALGVVFGLSAVPRLDAAVQYSRGNDRTRGDQVCFYKDINFQGAEHCYNPGDEISDLGDQHDSISSIRVYGRAGVTVYEDPAFRGHSTEFTFDVPDLGRRIIAGNTNWSDHIDSIRISPVSGTNINDRRNPDLLRRSQAQQPVDGICVYSRPNYAGRSECWNQGENISDLANQGNWNGQISSIRLFGSSVAMVFQNVEYGGESLAVNRDIPDLAAIRGRGTGNGRGRGNRKGLANWDRQISSVQVQEQRRGR